MRSYSVTLCRTSHVVIYVEAKSESEAERLAWLQVESGIAEDAGAASWDVEAIDPLFMREEA